MHAIITVGISASGKSTFAKSLEGYVEVNRDDIRFTKINPGGNWGTYKFSKQKENLVTEIQEQMVLKAIEDGKNIIISDTNLNPKTRDKWVQYLNGLGYTVEVKEFPIELEEAWKRDSLRANGVGHSVIYKQWQQWLVYKERKTYSQNDPHKPKAVICDIDGTLAHMTGRSPFDWHRVYEDSVDESVREILNAQTVGTQIIILSGRDSGCRDVTENWLQDNDILYDDLYMRAEGDTRKDSIVKEELFWEHIADNFNVKFVMDDRPQVCRLWYDLGLKVLNVGNPYIEF